MLKLKTIAAIGILAAAASASALAGNGAPSGSHYNLNIIGVDRAKTADLTGSQRHSIFVALTNQGDSHSNIYLTRGEFQVCDGNAFDTATDCSGNQIANQGAVFQLPCNTNLEPGGTSNTLVECTAGESAAYTVWARALGKPKGSATITTCATETTDVDGDGVLDEFCNTGSAVVVLNRTNGKQTFDNVTNELTSLVADIDNDGFTERVSLFSGGLEDWVWQYDNNGLRLAQLRFYLQ